MNLLKDNWIPIVRVNGERSKVAPWQIAQLENPAMDIQAPRPDFTGALYQFLIGLLQTAFAPNDQDEWLRLWECPPSTKDLRTILESLSPAFELINANGPAFLQDYALAEGELKPLAALLIEFPGAKTIKDNLDHFIKRDTATLFCESCLATALFTLQTNAPLGGVGHRVGLRGGGPLTTLLLPSTDNATLWRKLWLNVLVQETSSPIPAAADSTVFPWMGPTRISENGGNSTLPGDVNKLQVYWGMPRRIRLGCSSQSGNCSLCGEHSNSLYNQFRTKNYGVNYEGPWVHPLTPYRYDPKNMKPPNSVKGQQGGLGYRHWLGIAWTRGANGTGQSPAANVREFNLERAELLEENGTGDGATRLWCFGYDMDNMKARCWYEARMPVVRISDDYRDMFECFVSLLVDAAQEVLRELHAQIKAAWFNRPGDIRGDMSAIDMSFWERTEQPFYRQLELLESLSADIRFLSPTTANEWAVLLRRTAAELFDSFALEGSAEDMDMKRISKARRVLDDKLNDKRKMLKVLKNLALASSKKEGPNEQPLGT